MPIFKISPVKIVSFLLSATLLLNGLYLIPYKNYDNVIIPIHYGGLFSSIVVYDNKTYVVGDFPPAYILEEYLKMKYVRKIDGILLNDLDENTAKEIVRFERNVKISKIFISDVSDISGLKILAENYISTVFMFGDGDILSSVFEGVFDKNKFLAYSLNAENTDILFSKSLNFQSDIFNEYFNKASIVRTYYYYENLYDKIYLYNYAIGNTYEFSLDYNNIFNFSNGEFYKNLLY